MLIVLVPPALGSNQAGAAASAEWEGAALQSEWEQHLSELQGADPADALQRLLAEGTRYGHLADYQYWVAIYMLASDQPLEAVSLQLERALMMDPNHAGALYDYGAIQCRIGQEASCQTILKEARRRFGIPPVIKQSYNLAPVIRGELRLGLGHTNNYNQAGSADTIPLQFGTETLVVQLGNEQRPTATPYHWQSRIFWGDATAWWPSSSGTPPSPTITRFITKVFATGNLVASTYKACAGATPLNRQHQKVNKTGRYPLA